MTAANLRDVLGPAMTGGYAVAGLVVLGWEDATAFVEAAEATGCPVILQAGPGACGHTPIPVLGKMFRHLADQASVPVVCHIDHATSLETCAQGIEHGFTSVMFDGSRLPIGANIDAMQRIVAIARPAGVSVEGEVGFVGYAQGAHSAMTCPEEARLFDINAGADALAISVGNTHLQTEKCAAIDLAALRAIEAVTRLPLVLHGGSGISAATRRMLARGTRVCKFNIGTELRMAFGSALRKSLADSPSAFDRIALLAPVIPAMRAAAADVIAKLRGQHQRN